MIVTVVGTGYVGLVTGACLASHGHTVRCVDSSPERVALIRDGKAPFYEPGLEEVMRQFLGTGALCATGNLDEAMADSDLSLIAVGTPTVADAPDLSYVRTAAQQIGAALKAAADYHVVTVKSTVVPGTTRNLVQRCVEQASNRKLGDFGLCMNPEFLREGSAMEDFQDPDRIVIGQADDRSGDVLEHLYASFDCEKPRVSLEEAELIKYASNTLLGVLISFSNELAAVSESTPGIDVETVMQALYLDRRLSPRVSGRRVRPEILSYLRPGIGYGGSCLPKDVNALRAYARQISVGTPLLDATTAINSRRPEQIVSIVDSAIDGIQGKTVALLGIAFKQGTDDLRSSPALTLWRCLEQAGAHVKAYDAVVSPEAAPLAPMRGQCTQNLDEALAQADAALITMADPAFRKVDWSRLSAKMRQPVIIDGRNVLRNVILPAQVRYVPIGKSMPARQTVGSF